MLPIMAIGLTSASSPAITRSRVVADLRARNFANSWLHRTAGRLMDLSRLEPTKYQAFLEFLTLLHKEVQFPKLVLTLVVPNASLIAGMDLTVLSQHTSWIRRAYIDTPNRTCDLRELPNAYPDMLSGKIS